MLPVHARIAMSLLNLSTLLLLSLFLHPHISLASPLERTFNFIVRTPDTRRLRGMTADACITTGDCSGNRRCVREDSSTHLPCRRGFLCRCFPPIVKPCASTSECEAREICAPPPEVAMPWADSSNFCVSAIIAAYAAPGNSLKELRSPSRGLTMFPCTATSDCLGDRSCVYTMGIGGALPCEAEQRCYCFQNSPQPCEESTECELGELCGRVFDKQICVAADAEAGLREVTAVSAKNDGVIKLDSDVDLDETVKRKPGPAVDAPAVDAPAVDAPRKKTKGVSGEPCELSSHCEGERICILSEDALSLQPCEEGEDCICVPATGPDFCTAADECVARETCTKLPNVPDSACVSTVIVSYADDLESVGGTPKEERSPGAGFTLYPCSNTKECEGDRVCSSALDDSSKRCKDNESCFCVPEDLRNCKASQECEGREVCAKMTEAQICVSEDVEAAIPEIEAVDLQHVKEEEVSAEPSGSQDMEENMPTDEEDEEASPDASSADDEPGPSPDLMTVTPTPTSSGSETGDVEGNTCIDARALTHLPASSLAWTKHAWATVLCDAEGSCATEGHIVRFEGVAMRMASYCEGRGCVEKRMLVNSPKYARGMRLLSRTQGLTYTAFAARYGTRVEEVLIAVALRAGL